LIELPKFTNYYQEISNCILWPALHNIYRNVLINKETGLALDGIQNTMIFIMLKPMINLIPIRSR